jgi:probable HAF family extracellular repeat protein
MKKQVGMALCLAWVAVCCLAESAPAIKFKYEDLGTLGGTQLYTGFDGKEAGINYAGQVVGKSYTAGGSLHAFVKSPGQTMVDLGNIPDSTESLAPCINGSGVVGGYYQDVNGSHACRWVPGGGGYTFQDLGGDNSQVNGMNEAGYLVGGAVMNGGFHAAVKPPVGDPTDLGTLPGCLGSLATGINSSRTIVGYSYDSSDTCTACVWYPSGGGYTSASPLFGVTDSRAHAVNTSGQAVGYAKISGVLHVVLQNPGQALRDLGGLLPGWNSAAFDLNDSGWVVGWGNYYSGPRAVLWTSAWGMQDLNNLVVNLPPGVVLEQAMAINKKGEIAGYTENSVFKLHPIRVPFSYLLLVD